MPQRLALSTLDALRDPAALRVDTIIDTRSPGEFGVDHLPGAINLPVLDDAERARVGTIHAQHSRFNARRTGAALVARNIARHLEHGLHDRPRGWRPLVYCWRGGQRSNGMALILEQVGWPVQVLEGGYRSFRRLVHRMLYETTLPFRLVLLDGNTGTAKTELLALLARGGVQTLDLEAMAGHRGSVFGLTGNAQPTQKAFESRLAMALTGLDPARPVVVEAESNRIGQIRLPPMLWKPMQTARRLQIAAPVNARADYLLDRYGDLIRDPDRLRACVAALRPYHAAERIAEWQQMIAQRDFAGLATGLITDHYDPRYQRMRAGGTGGGTTLHTETLAPAALPLLADRIASRLD